MYKVALILAGFDEFTGFASPPPHLGLCHLKTYAETHCKSDIEIQIFHDTKSLIEYKPDMVGISAITPTFTHAIATAEKIKKAILTYVVLGGTHITFLPDEIRYDCFDIGVIGEGEKTFAELIDALADEGPLEGINGLAYKENGNIKITPKRELLPISEIPIPTSGQTRSDNYRAYIFSSRGCPYKCKYCASSAFWGSNVRHFSPEHVLGEVRWHYENFGVTKITFRDDLFIFPEEKLFAIVDLLEKEGLLSKIQFSGHVRANLMTKSIYEALKKLNFKDILFGAESGSDRILKIYKPAATAEMNQKCVDDAIKYGFGVVPYIMAGFPGETREDLLLTAEFIEKNITKAKWRPLNLFMPFPGSEAWDSLEKETKDNMIMSCKWDDMNVKLSKSNFNNIMYFNDELIPRDEFFDILLNHFPHKVLINNSIETTAWYLNELEKAINNNKNVYLYGAGRICRRIAAHVSEHMIHKPSDGNFGIKGIVDKNYENISSVTYANIPILPPSVLSDESDELIFITSSKYYSSIKDDLLSMGVSVKRIVPLPDDWLEE
jgi:radical SAM superfamily enzyme YgiQ (UPF0313 family)